MHRAIVLVLAGLAAAIVLGAHGAGATAPGLNGRIVFADDGSPGSELFSVAPDGSDREQLTWTFEDEGLPAWSPDGSQIAYASGTTVWIMNADGSGQHQLIDGTEPKWSPDGTQIALVRRDAIGRPHLWVVNPDGTGPRQVSTATANEPDWSPDGTHLVYEGSDGLATVAIDGSDHQTVVGRPGQVGTPSWSPDGREIAFSELDPTGRLNELAIVNADGTGEHQLTQGAIDVLPSWSPDGTQLVFQHRQAGTSAVEIYVVNADGTGERFLTSGRAPAWGTSQGSPHVSPPLAPFIQISSPSADPGYIQGEQAGAFYRCGSAVSYIISCDGDVPFGGQIDTSAGTHTFSVRATDADGHTSVDSVTYNVVDIFPPQIDVRTPADGAVYAQGSVVSVDYSCSDPGGSGIDFCQGDRPDGAALDTSTLGSHTFTVVAGDNAEHVTTKSATYTVVASPTIQITSPTEGGLYATGAAVTVTYSCTDLVSAGIRDCRGDVPSGSLLDTSQPGTHSFSVTAVDGLGDTATKSVTFKVVGPPFVIINSPRGDYTIGSSVTADYACQAQVFNPTSCTGDVANGSPIDTSSPGPKTFHVTATDVLGQTTTGASPYRIVYPFSGFDAPVSAGGVVDGAKPGKGIALKFSLTGDRGDAVVTGVTWQQVSCTDGTAIGVPQAGTGRLSYTPSSDRYLDVVATDSSWKGSCRRLTLRLTDTTEHSVTVNFTH